MKTITASLVNMYHICKREMWLHFHNINMEQTSDTVFEGKLIGETTYQQRPAKYTELALGNAKIDYYDAKNKVVHEVKKSDKVEEAHIAQVQYYLFLLEEAGVIEPTGLIEYPKLRKTLPVAALSDEEKKQIQVMLQDIERLLASPVCPPRKTKKTFCATCSYFEFCWSEEI
jgi:CRISPR-associated exonuclease Cas4